MSTEPVQTELPFMHQLRKDEFINDLREFLRPLTGNGPHKAYPGSEGVGATKLARDIWATMEAYRVVP